MSIEECGAMRGQTIARSYLDEEVGVVVLSSQWEARGRPCNLGPL